MQISPRRSNRAAWQSEPPGKRKGEPAMSPIPRLRDYRGPALFSYGFRPFFLFGAIFAGAAMLLWLPVFNGEITFSSVFAARDWHVHEMLFGFLPAILTGFLLTAIPNWTGSLPIQGTPLIALLATWMAGRVAVAFSATIGWIATAAIDSTFLLLVAAIAAREIVAGRNWSNLKIVGIATLLALANVLFHLEAHFHGAADYAIRFGIGVAVVMISFIAGRIIPSFTRNWLARQSAGRMPATFGRFDIITIATSAIALAAWVAAPFAPATGAALVAAGLAQTARLARWAGERTVANPLLLILHVGYAFIPAGFFLVAATAFGVAPPSAGIHAWTAGAIGTMTLAVMTRASLGHTGHALSASRGTQIIYAAIVLGALLRLAAALLPGWSEPLLSVAAVSWGGAFLGFGALYGRILCSPRYKAKANANA
jgi:uncharacterized protein involved in response to NO